MNHRDELLEEYTAGRLTRAEFIRRAGALGLSAAAASALAACGSTAAVGRASRSRTQLVLAAAATPTTLDPEFSSTPQDRESDVSVYDRFTQFKVVDQGGLRQADIKAPPIPLMAESWTVANGGRRYIFELRRGVKSYYGNELTTEDVLWSWDRVFALQSQGLFPLGVSSVAKGSYRALSRYTLEVNLTSSNPLLPIVLATPVPGAVIYDSTEVKRHTSPADPWARRWLASHTASFGPYNAQQFTPGQQVVYVANPNYYGTPPRIREVIYKEIPESSERLALLKAGQADIAEDLTAEERHSLRGAATVRVVSVPGNLAVIFGLNNSMAPFTDVRIRQAVAYAMPVPQIIQSVYFGDPTVRLFRGYVADTFPGYPNYWPYQPANIEKAKRLVEAAGKSGTSFELSYTTTYPEHALIATYMRTALQPIGLNATLNELTPAAYQQQYYTHQAQSVLVQDAAFVADGIYPLYLYFGAGKGAVGNWIDYRDPAVQNEINVGLGVPDIAKRIAMGRAIDKEIVTAAPWAMYLGIGFHMPMAKNVHGLVWRPTNLIEFHDLWMS